MRSSFMCRLCRAALCGRVANRAQRIDWTGPLTDLREPRRDRLRGDQPGRARGLERRIPERQPRGDGGGMGAPRTVRCAIRMTRPLDRLQALSVEEAIRAVVEVAAGDDRSA